MPTIDELRTAAEAKGLTVICPCITCEGGIIYIFLHHRTQATRTVQEFQWSPFEGNMSRAQALAAAMNFLDGWPFDPLTFEGVQAEAEKKGWRIDRDGMPGNREYLLYRPLCYDNAMSFYDPNYGGDALPIVWAIVRAWNPKEAPDA